MESPDNRKLILTRRGLRYQKIIYLISFILFMKFNIISWDSHQQNSGQVSSVIVFKDPQLTLPQSRPWHSRPSLPKIPVVWWKIYLSFPSIRSIARKLHWGLSNIFPPSYAHWRSSLTITRDCNIIYIVSEVGERQQAYVLAIPS